MKIRRIEEAVNIPHFDRKKWKAYWIEWKQMEQDRPKQQRWLLANVWAGLLTDEPARPDLSNMELEDSTRLGTRNTFVSHWRLTRSSLAFRRYLRNNNSLTGKSERELQGELCSKIQAKNLNQLPVVRTETRTEAKFWCLFAVRSSYSSWNLGLTRDPFKQNSSTKPTSTTHSEY